MHDGRNRRFKASAIRLILWYLILINELITSPVIALVEAQSTNRTKKLSNSNSFLPPLVIFPTYQSSSSDNDTIFTTNITILNDKTLLPRKGYLATTIDEFSVISPMMTSNYDNQDQQQQRQRNSYRVKLQRTSEQLKKHNCYIGTNGGPYNKDGTSVGAIIMNGRIIPAASSSTSFGGGIGFGITRPIRSSTDQRKSYQSWVIGSISNLSQAQELKLWNYVSGFDWLVYDGENAVLELTGTGKKYNYQNDEENILEKERSSILDSSSGPINPEGEPIAPRTAIGITSDGRLLLLVVDGCEYCFRRKGLTLKDLSEVMIKIGAKYAINLDGGGSSTIVNESGNVINVPTCLNIPLKCERPVNSVVCIKRRKETKKVNIQQEISENMIIK